MSVARSVGMLCHRPLIALSFAATLAPLAAGCVEMDGEPITNEVQQSTSCPGGAPRRDPVSPEVIKAFYPCCNGRAHLIPDFLVPESFREMLDKGPDGTSTLCVPDEFAINPDFTPKTCRSLFGQPGACISECIPQVRDAPTPLPQADGAPGERCAPCVDPRTNEETGACKMGQMACQPAPPTPGSDQCKQWDPEPSLANDYPVCCPGARCVPKELVEDSLAKDLAPCPGGYCTPEKFLIRGGKYVPATCRAIGDVEGRCLSTCIKSIKEQADQLEQGSCDRGEVCAPCYDPRTGIGTGACTAGLCDKPKEPVKKFKDCGPAPDTAWCVPASLVPAKDRCNFDTQGCAAAPVCDPGDLCVPKAIIDAGPTFQPRKCKATTVGLLALLQKLKGGLIAAITAMKEYSEGRCLSKCLPQVRKDAGMLSQNGCSEGEICVPCYDPRQAANGKVPTGACDTNRRCPGT